MPLIDLKTSLKDLKFTGPAPYVRKDINNPGSPAANQVQARIDDISRISKMFIDRPGGIFMAKQAMLQASQIPSLTQISAGNTIIPVAARLGTILAQIPVNRTGTHFSVADLAGVNSTYYRTSTASSDAKYAGKVTGRTSSQYLNPVFKYNQLLQNTLGYNSTVGITPTSNAAEKNGEIKVSTFSPDIKNKELYGLSKQVQGGRSLDNEYKFAGANTSDGVNLLKIGEDGKDLMPLKANILGNLNSLVVFRGFIDNISDSFNGTWTDNNYVGRAESLYTYSKFSRSLSFTFKVPVFSAAEQSNVYDKVNTFVSFTAPSYSDSGFAQGTILQIQLGDLLRTNAVLNTAAVTVENNVPWSVGDAQKLLPQVLTINVNFSIIHSVIPATSLWGKRYIGNGGDPGDLDRTPKGLTDFGALARAESDARIRQQFEFGRELSQVTGNLIRGLSNTALPVRSPRTPRPVIEVGDGTFGPAIFD